MIKNYSSLTFAAAALAFPLLYCNPASARPKTTSFAEFDRRAQAGEQLNVAFFGASLTWGANASEPNQTSYRGGVANKLRAKYPKARFRFWDGAIGGTGSQLGVYRLERDVLKHDPDLVFLDFSANDDIYSENPESLASYESLVRRIVTEANTPLVQVIFPFKWNVDKGPSEYGKMKRRDAHKAISRYYGTSVGDAIELAIDRVGKKEVELSAIWPFDGVHPGDTGYALFADAAWKGYLNGLDKKLAPVAPAKMLYAPTFTKWNRVRITSLGALPQGWKASPVNRTSAYYDMLMSRWLDDEAVASNRREWVDEKGKKQNAPQEFSPLKVKFRGSFVMLFGESTQKSGLYKVLVDGKTVTFPAGKDKPEVAEVDAGRFATAAQGNVHHVQIVARDLDPKVEHTLEIVPLFPADQHKEVRLESICVAGGDAWVKAAE